MASFVLPIHFYIIRFISKCDACFIIVFLLLKNYTEKMHVLMHLLVRINQLNRNNL